MSISKNNGFAYDEARSWLCLLLTDTEQIEEHLWGNYIEAGLEEHPTQAEIEALAPLVLEALTLDKPLPVMHPDIRRAFAEYLASYDGMVLASETANRESEEQGKVIQEVYMDLCDKLL